MSQSAGTGTIYLRRDAWIGAGRRVNGTRGMVDTARMAVLALQEVVVDCEDPRVLAVFWAAVFGAAPVRRGTDWAYVESAATRIRIAFQRVPELKSVKNRVHLDLEVDDIAQERVRLESLGAAAVGVIESDDFGPFQVMTDPEQRVLSCCVTGEHCGPVVDIPEP